MMHVMRMEVVRHTLDVIHVLYMSQLLCPMKDEASRACVESAVHLMCVRVTSVTMAECHTVLFVLHMVSVEHPLPPH
jgi:hypothetical protein